MKERSKLLKDKSIHLSVDVDQIPCVLELSDVTVTQQSVFFVRIEEGKVLHDDGCKEK